jgi:hypothetical protein
MLVLRHKRFAPRAVDKKGRQRCLWRPGVQNRHFSNGAAAFSLRLDIQHDREDTAYRCRHPVIDREAASHDALSLIVAEAPLTADASR